ncbi:hypothetical protein C8J57DRAFT_1234079 [Mycena rebaudengoi]|nr:hypothetical protein C8J57DRAFT_1234079 [Mycena rebaudengoi]
MGIIGICQIQTQLFKSQQLTVRANGNSWKLLQKGAEISGVKQHLPLSNLLDQCSQWWPTLATSKLSSLGFITQTWVRACAAMVSASGDGLSVGILAEASMTASGCDAKGIHCMLRTIGGGVPATWPDARSDRDDSDERYQSNGAREHSSQRESARAPSGFNFCRWAARAEKRIVTESSPSSSYSSSPSMCEPARVGSGTSFGHLGRVVLRVGGQLEAGEPDALPTPRDDNVQLVNVINPFAQEPLKLHSGFLVVCKNGGQGDGKEHRNVDEYRPLSNAPRWTELECSEWGICGLNLEAGEPSLIRPHVSTPTSTRDAVGVGWLLNGPNKDGRRSHRVSFIWFRGFLCIISVLFFSETR